MKSMGTSRKSMSAALMIHALGAMAGALGGVNTAPLTSDRSSQNPFSFLRGGWKGGSSGSGTRANHKQENKPGQKAMTMYANKYGRNGSMFGTPTQRRSARLKAEREMKAMNRRFTQHRQFLREFGIQRDRMRALPQ
jgi:hypothetical protein